MSQDIQLRQENPDESDRMAVLEEPDNTVYGRLSRDVADRLGEYLQLTLSEEADVMGIFERVTGDGDGNYAVFETPGGAVVGLGVHLDTIADVFGIEIERDESGVVQNAPDGIGLTFSASGEDAWEEAVEEEEDNSEEVEGLIAGDSDESDDEEEVEISDEELDLVDA